MLQISMKKFFLVTPVLLINKPLLSIFKCPKSINKGIEESVHLLIPLCRLIVNALYDGKYIALFKLIFFNKKAEEHFWLSPPHCEPFLQMLLSRSL